MSTLRTRRACGCPEAGGQTQDCTASVSCLSQCGENSSDLAAMARAELSGAEHVGAQGESWGWLRASGSPAPWKDAAVLASLMSLGPWARHGRIPAPLSSSWVLPSPAQACQCTRDAELMQAQAISIPVRRDTQCTATSRQCCTAAWAAR